MNRLQHETSPYLLQHADNPVDWYAWKPEAFAAARAQNKPILVSIGYSTCHWCHVMERESFEKEAVAAFMNAHFINIKVDREERPDVDQIYMEACQAIHGSGGWPLNCFLTPDGRPFFAGTYYPPRPAHQRPSWLQLLQQMAHAYSQRREEVEQQADQLTRMIERSDDALLAEQLVRPEGERQVFDPETLDAIFQAMRRHFDRTHGGFGSAPKFPSAMALQVLFHYGATAERQEAIDHALFSLDKMVHGGIYDQLGGGMARYATDRAWLVPHFEKMLYDNALLIDLLTTAWQLTGRGLYRRKLHQTAEWLRREMTHPEGGFFAALDADSEGEEGKFYVWSEAEIDEVLGDDASVFKAFYGVSLAGNWEGVNILAQQQPLPAFARSRQLEPEALAQRLDRQRQQLLERRGRRIRPGRDEKIVLSWNAMMIGALARAAAALDDTGLAELAEGALHFVLDKLRREDGGMWHSYKDGRAQFAAYLDDYALLIDALLAAYSLSWQRQWLAEADRLTQWVLDRFDDPERGMLFYTEDQQEALIVRKRELYDSATPSGNAVMAHNLLRLAILFDRPDYRTRAESMLLRMQATITKYPTSFARWASALAWVTHPTAEIAIVGSDFERQARALHPHFLPQTVVMAAEEPVEEFPLLRGREPGDDTLIFVCRQYACQRPVREMEEALKLVNEST